MGIYDRDYYRKDGPSFLASFTGQGSACKWLIAINVILFVASLLTPAQPAGRQVEVGRGRHVVIQAPAGDEAEPQFGERSGYVNEALELEPQAALHGQVWRLLTYAFLHAGIWHILFNMLFLWWFGHEMEEMYGSREFVIFFLVSAILGGVAYTIWAWGRHMMAPCVGASGAVTAVMVLYAFHFPSRIIRLWFFLPIPIWLFVLFEVAQDTFIFATGMPTSTAVTVHLAGAAFGFAYYKGNLRLAPIWTWLTSFRLPQRRPRLRVYEEQAPPSRRPRPTAASAPSKGASSPADEQLEAQVDAVLEKVARSGHESLSETEKALLVRASEVYRRRQRL